MNSNKYYNFAKNELFPICRSITGKGTEQTLKKIQRFFPKLKIYKIKSGTIIFDWKIPEEWNIKNAYVIDKYQNKIIDFKKNNLHIVGYSKIKLIAEKKLKTLKKISKMKILIHRFPAIYSRQSINLFNREPLSLNGYLEKNSNLLKHIVNKN